MEKLKDFYVVFLRTEHGRQYWRIVNDDDDVNYMHKIKSYMINANSIDDAEAIAYEEFPLRQWEFQESVEFD